MRKTKIICTLGPATEEPETRRQVVHEGANVFRLNMSHAQHDWVREIVPRIRAIAQELGRAVAILMYTQGPAIRTGDLKTDLHLKPGDILEFTVRGAKSEEAYSVDVNYDGLINDINEGDTVLVDNGVIHLLVLEKRENRIRCKVITPGTLSSRRHINLPVVVATHMLESMIHNPLPTRAEITDVANAVFEQADAIMLSGETSLGDYPVECVRILNRVALRIERSGGAGYAKAAVLEDVRQKTVASAIVLANSLSRARIIVFTRHGAMARNAANLRPESATIFAFTPSEEVRRQLALCWGTYPVRIKFSDDPNATIEVAEKYLRDAGLTSPGDNLVIISDLRAGDTLVDTVQLRTAR